MVKNYAPHKNEIIRLYKDHNVDEVVKIMEDDHKFKASRRWYLTMFAEWKCQKTSNRKKIQNRRRKEKSSEPLSTESGDDNPSHRSSEDYASRMHKSSSSSPGILQFLLECPYASCVAGPFALPHDYLDHKTEIHEFHPPLVKLGCATTVVGARLEEYLGQAARGSLPDMPSLQRPPREYTEAEMIDCAQVVLDHEFEHCQVAGIVATLLSGKLDRDTATFVMDGLISVASKVLGYDNDYPTPIRWIDLMAFTCESEIYLLNWEFDLCFISRNTPAVLRTYAQTHMLETYISRLETSSNLSVAIIPTIEKVCDVCYDLQIPLDVSYIRILHQLKQE